MNTITRIPSEIVFIPYQENIRKVYMYFLQYYINEQDTSLSYAKFDLYVITNLGVVYSIKNKLFYDKRYRTVYLENWGELNVYSSTWKDNIPLQTLTEIWIEPRMDVASMSNNKYKIDDVLTDRWFPSYNGCFLRLNGTLTGSFFDKKELFEGWPDSAYGYELLSMRRLIADTKDAQGNIQIASFFIERLENYRTHNKRMGIKLGASVIYSSNYYITENGLSFGYPQWMHTKYTNNYNQYSVPPYYVINTTDHNTGNPISICYLNWKNSTVRTDFAACMTAIHNYLTGNPTGTSMKYEKYIDYIIITFAGTWGEGLSLDMPGNFDYPSANDLIAVADSIRGVLPDKVHIQPLGTTMNAEFPQSYRDSIMNGNTGIFFDGTCNMSRYYFLEGNTLPDGSVGNPKLSASTPELMNKAFTYSKKHMVKLECSVSFSSGSKSNYADLEAFAHYLNPDIFCLDNMFLNKIVADTMPPAIMNSIKRISRYVGTRPYILINNVSLSKSGTKYYLNPNISIGNFGTALFMPYWKLRFYIKAHNGSYLHSAPIESGFDLTTIPKAFIPGKPNYYDMKTLNTPIELTGITLTNNQYYDIMIAIEDVDGIYQKNLLFCNNEESLPRELNNSGQLTGKFYLYSNYKFVL